MIIFAGKKACSENNLTHIQGYSSVGRAAVSKCKRMFVCLFFCNFLETTISNSSQKFSESQISILELFFFKEIKIRKNFGRSSKEQQRGKTFKKTIKKRFSTIAESVFNSKLQLCSNNIRAALFVQHFNFVQSVAVDFILPKSSLLYFSAPKKPLTAPRRYFYQHPFSPSAHQQDGTLCLQQKS